MRITFDPEKRNRTLAERGLDFVQALQVFAGPHLEVPDNRRNYGEPRVNCYGYLNGRMVVVGFTRRGDARHIFSMRKANEREKSRYAPVIDRA
jgi:uncharacterized DUF497 family protein